MPRSASGPRLWLDKKRQSWSIIDGSRTVRTGCGAGELEQAKEALGAYLAKNHIVTKGANPFIADCLKLYGEEHLKFKVSYESTRRDLINLNLWWGTKRATDITKANCRLYSEHRNAPTCSGRELGFLAAAMNYYHKSEYGPLGSIPIIVKPDKAPSRERWLTRSEAAKFLWATRLLPHLRRKRLRRFFLIGWYTGTRHAAICNISWSMVDLDSGIMQRRPAGIVETKKRTPPVRMSPRLIAHMRRWKRLDAGKTTHLIEHGGRKVSNVNDAWLDNRKLAGLGNDVIPHSLRHSRATHMMKQGVNAWEAAQALGMSVEMLQRTYGHHSPDWQRGASQAR